MKLPEYRGKELLRRAGVRVPPGIVTDNKSYINLSYHKERYRDFFFEHGAVVIKAQVLSGRRKKNQLIVESEDYAQSLQEIDALYAREVDGQPVTTLLVEKRLSVAAEYYLSILYDTVERKPMILLSRQGGVSVEELAHEHPPARLHVSPIDGLHDYQARALARAAGFRGREALGVARFVKRAYACFADFDCRILEINPVLKTKEGLLFAGDAKITIDDNAVARQEVFHDLTDIEDRSVLSERALEARKIDYHDHRGVAGKTFVELDGDIAVLASGGGASLTCMDALIEAGGRPANYAEYSGNPPPEKVRRLTEITLSKPGLTGCFVVGGTANFTDIYETMKGFTEGLKRITPKPDYPIVVRRAGPREQEAYELLARFAKEEGFDLTVMGEETPMTKAARVMVEKAKEYAHRRAASEGKR